MSSTPYRKWHLATHFVRGPVIRCLIRLLGSACSLSVLVDSVGFSFRSNLDNLQVQIDQESNPGPAHARPMTMTVRKEQDTCVGFLE